MIAWLGDRLSALFRRLMPDPFVLALLLTLLAALLAFAFGFPAEAGGGRPGAAARALRLLDAWRADEGLWKFLAFGMQMCLILVTGHALAASRTVRRGIEALARRPRSTRSAAATIGLVACAAAVVNWGLGLIVGALLARDVGRSMSRRGVPAHYPLLAAAGYAGLLIWHGGLSGSAPLTMTTAAGAARVLPAAELVRLGRGGIPLGETLFSPLNLFVTFGLVVLVPLLLARLAPPAGRKPETFGSFGADLEDDRVAGDEDEAAAHRGLPERLERSRLLAWLLIAPLLLALLRHGQTSGLERLGLNEINAAMLALGLIFHGSLRSYLEAVNEGVKGCAGIILQFPLYAGIMSMLTVSGLVEKLAGAMAAAGGARGIPILTCLSAALVNLFVPSGGGQWGIQGPVALAAGLEAGIEPGKMVMAVAYGDQLTNMLQPFWALPLLAITGVKARDIVGYTSILMLAAGLWILAALLIF